MQISSMLVKAWADCEAAVNAQSDGEAICMRVEEIVGRRIREHRELNNLSQEDFGKFMGVLLSKPWPRQTVSVAEQGKRQFTPTELVACSQVLGIAVERLFSVPADVASIEMPSGHQISRDKVMRPLPEDVADRSQVQARLSATLDSLASVRIELMQVERLLSRAGGELDGGLKQLIDDVEMLDQVLATAAAKGGDDVVGDQAD